MSKAAHLGPPGGNLTENTIKQYDKALSEAIYNGNHTISAPTVGGTPWGGSAPGTVIGPGHSTSFTLNPPNIEIPLDSDLFVCLENEWFVLTDPGTSDIEQNIRHRCDEFIGLNDSSIIVQLNEEYWGKHCYLCSDCDKPVPDNVKITAGLVGL